MAGNGRAKLQREKLRRKIAVCSACRVILGGGLHASVLSTYLQLASIICCTQVQTQTFAVCRENSVNSNLCPSDNEHNNMVYRLLHLLNYQHTYISQDPHNTLDT